ncbi:hypothetical protein G3580_06750 [Nitrogeniibacter mangrovi]|uniref:Uncharacterized protein n=1 Tax=Nitrogeniibacter mangrovi TaxID=2016596 RepID=A0A6C1B177_9RHOO|nr:hypothetical protein [Nitrogeniibacter mangrovi]QID17371.1 hypothetical protein G3580_06750 [Nitrogeniibacter mangrovi]
MTFQSAHFSPIVPMSQPSHKNVDLEAQPLFPAHQFISTFGRASDHLDHQSVALRDAEQIPALNNMNGASLIRAIHA